MCLSLSVVFVSPGCIKLQCKAVVLETLNRIKPRCFHSGKRLKQTATLRQWQLGNLIKTPQTERLNLCTK
uniref:Uncharacterized protein n=1 Tax=Anguilla anguilla TaxID=7936 RepID=A0A0E9XCK3_ANGAN